MEDSALHGFRFKSQTPLLVCDGDCAHHAETEPGKCPPSPGYEALYPLPSSTYHHKAQQTPSVAHHSNHGRRAHYETIALGAARRLRASRRLLESIDSDPTIADGHESDLVQHLSYSWTAQPSNVMDYDEVMCDGAGLESPETNDFSHGGCMDSASPQYNELEASTVAMADVREDADEDIAIDFEDIYSFDSEDDNSLGLDFEGGNLFDFEDASSRQTDESSVEESTDDEDEFESADDDDWESEDEDGAESELENEYPRLYMSHESAMEAFERTMKIIFGP